MIGANQVVVPGHKAGRKVQGVPHMVRGEGVVRRGPLEGGHSRNPGEDAAGSIQGEGVAVVGHHREHRAGTLGD